MPSKLVPSKNATLVMLPLELLADAVMVIMAGAVKDAPLVGVIIVTVSVGTALETTDTVIGLEMFVAPKLSNASAVSVWLPMARFTEME